MTSPMRLPVSFAVAAVATLAMTVLPGAAVARASHRVSVAIERIGDAVVIRASAEVEGDPGIGWQVLTDYRRYAEFVPGVRASRVIERHGAEVTVEQTGNAPWWLLDATVDVIYRITESAPYALHSHALADDGATLDSDYTLTPDPAGIRLDYAGRLVAPRGLLVRLREAAGEQAIVTHLRALAAEIARRSKADDEAQARSKAEVP